MTMDAGSTPVSPRKSSGGGILRNDRKYLRSKAPQQIKKADPLDDLKSMRDAVSELEYVEVEEPRSPRRSPVRGSSPRSSPTHRTPIRRSNSLGAGLLASRSDDEIVEYVLDESEVEIEDDDDVEEVIDDTEYEELEDYEEVELGDGDYEELVLEDDDPAAMKQGNITPSPTDEETEHEEPQDEEEQENEDLPERDDVLEAINYIMTQEQVIKYGLVSQDQADEMNELPLTELMEIMNHFEACDNTNSPIRWDLVLALTNPKYAADVEVDDASEDELDEDEKADKVAELGHSAHPSGPDLGAPRDSDEFGASIGDGLSVLSDVNVNACNDCNKSVGSFCLDANKLDCDSSMSNASDDELVLEAIDDSNQSSTSNFDPRIRANYAKSMHELKRRNSFD